jgi:hypothetical protein
MSPKCCSVAALLALFLLCHSSLLSVRAADLGRQSPDPNMTSPGDWKTLKLYPHAKSERPNIPSPYKMPDGTEVIVAFTKQNEYAIVPVTVENGPLNLPYGSRGVGKGKQLEVDADDFPTLAKTGLHCEEELDRTKTITGKAVAQITRIGRPGMSSGVGFMAGDEDIISVLKGDNQLVKRLDLTHPQMARPLFYVWNLILKEYELDRMGRYWDNIKYILYNGRRIRFGEVHPTRGFQESIFGDEIMGAFQISFYRELDKEEKQFLGRKYAHLNEEQMADLVKRLSHIHTGEMEPYYVMRYGFYEGHTGYRVDPIAIAFIFGLRSLEEIELAFGGRLYELLTTHFTK